MTDHSPYGKAQGMKNLLSFIDASEWTYDMDYNRNMERGSFYLVSAEGEQILEYNAEAGEGEEHWIDHSKLLHLFNDLKKFDAINMKILFFEKYCTDVRNFIRTKYNFSETTKFL